MPFPWKKSRILRIVADLQPPKRSNSSLVVETGFPTSLIDLFVKNRDRLKKPNIKRRKKHQSQPQQQQNLVGEIVVVDPIQSSETQDLSVEYDQRPENLEGMPENFNNIREVCVLDDRIKDENDSLDCCYNENKNGKCLFVAILKMFVVVVLALSTKRLAVGITLSASFLIFLEYIGKRFFGFLKPCLNARMSFRYLTERVVFFLRRRPVCLEGSKTVGVEIESNVISSCDLIENVGLNTCIEEIQVVEARVDKVVPVEDENTRVEQETMRDLLRQDAKWTSIGMGEVRIDDEGGPVICEKQHGRVCRLRRKIVKKLVPKKLRAIKKAMKDKAKDVKEVDSKSEVSSYWEEDKLCSNGDDVEERDGSDQVKLWQLMEERKPDERVITRKGSKKEKKEKYTKGHECHNDEEKEQNRKENESKTEEKEKINEAGNESFELRNSDLSNGLRRKSDKVVVEERVDIERGGSSGYLMLFLIVLAGLVGGRMLALLLTVASCSMVKLVWRRRRSVKEPAKLSPKSISS